MDCLFINPGGSAKSYQGLSVSAAAVEPPTWALMIAEAIRNRGYQIGLIDANAEKLGYEQIADRVISLKPRIVVFVVYGQNVNAGATSMSGAVGAAEQIKFKWPNSIIVFLGSYMQALPLKVLEDELCIDIACTNEGVKSLLSLLALETLDVEFLRDVPGIVYRDKNCAVFSEVPEVVGHEELEQYYTGYAWDLLPKNEKFLDLYRSPYWHANYIEEYRTPYAALQTSIGCNFGCKFCMINTVNRNDNAEIGVASNYSGMRFFSVDSVVREIKYLLENGVKTIRFIDEMFLLNKKHYIPICKALEKINKNDDLRLWAYSRVDTVANHELLGLLRRAGFRWLCLGIESGDKKVRFEVAKGKFEDVNIRNVIDAVHEAGIEVMANYMFGLPGDSKESMQKTLDLSLELNTSGWNAYAAMALPGSELYKICLDENMPIPKAYSAFSFHSYDSFPMGTEFLEPSEVLEFREKAFEVYHSDKCFQKRIKEKFGSKAVDSINNILKTKLKRKLIEQGK